MLWFKLYDEDEINNDLTKPSFLVWACLGKTIIPNMHFIEKVQDPKREFRPIQNRVGPKWQNV